MNRWTVEIVTRRLKIIEGQVRGVQRMAEEGEYCVDILNQISAVRAALDGVGRVILKGHVEGCVVRAIKGGDDEEKDRMIDELMEAIFRGRSYVE